MKERPITLDDRMAAGIRDGRKTQLRVPVAWQGVERVELLEDGQARCHVGDASAFKGDHTFQRQCPFGSTRDRLWVREAWDVVDPAWPHAEGRDARPWQRGPAVVVYRIDGPAPGQVPWRPAAQMPREASRLLLEVRSVRLERLAALTVVDVVAELGVVLQTRADLTELDQERLRQSGIAYWASVHGKGRCSWESNPWTWVVGVELVQEVLVRSRRPMSHAELAKHAEEVARQLSSLGNPGNPPFFTPETTGRMTSDERQTSTKPVEKGVGT